MCSMKRVARRRSKGIVLRIAGVEGPLDYRADALRAHIELRRTVSPKPAIMSRA